MSNFLLIHGAWQGAWAWQPVIDQLEAKRESHEVGQVLAPELPGHGKRSSDEIRRITVEHYINSVVTPAQVMRLDDVVLVGHGFAATFIPQVALELGDKVKRIIFIAGELPAEGKKPCDRLSPWWKMMLRVFKDEENGFRFPDFIAKGILCNGLDRISAGRVLSRLTPEPFLPWKTPINRQGFAGRFPTTYVILTKDKVIRPRLQRRYSQTLSSPEIEEVKAGHCALLSHPREIADLLLKHA